MIALSFGMIADKLHREGFSVGHVRFMDASGRLLWSANASRDGRRGLFTRRI